MSGRPAPLAVGGWNVLDAALRAGLGGTVHVDAAHAERALAAGVAASRLQIYERRALKARFGGEAHQGVVLELDPLPWAQPEDLAAAAVDQGLPLVVLEEVQDPQNVGSIARAARALGAAGLVLTKHRSAPLGAAAIRASAGALLGLPVAQVGGVPNWLQRLEPRLTTLAAVAPNQAADALAPCAAPLGSACVLILGAEGHGLKRLTCARAQIRVSIAQTDWESLNVAQAAAILLYEAAVQRLGSGRGALARLDASARNGV